MGRRIGLLVVVALLAATPALAWHVDGYVRCDGNENNQLDGQDLGMPGVVVNVTGVADGQPFAGSATTDGNGYYYVTLPDFPGSFTATLDAATLPADATIVIPGAGHYDFATTGDDFNIRLDWLVASDTCKKGECWMTGGGTYWDNLLGLFTAQRDPKHSFGGNVHPSCSPDPGAGGNWNHIDRKLKLHFQGTTIPTVACGNVDGIPPGSESPVTPFNYIEYQGTGRLKGIQGNKVDMNVAFFARVEDRNEPGSNGAKDGSLIDRYFLRVYDPVTGNTLLLVDGDGDPNTVDPVPINTGNLQIHVSSCDNPPLQ